MKNEQPSGQTAIQAVLDVFGTTVLGIYQSTNSDYLLRLDEAVDRAEAAINAHIVSVLEELKEKSAYDQCGMHPVLNPLEIDAAIAKYKEGGNHD